MKARRAVVPSSLIRPRAAQSAGSIGATARRSASISTGTPTEEEADQRGQRPSVAGSPEQAGPVQDAQAELVHLLHPALLGNVGLVETDPVKNLADAVDQVRPINGERGFVGQTAHEGVSRDGRIEVGATVKPAPPATA